ncbi:Hypp6167 [Branchiostoma lanceolatum]|uniref:Hypp6167 protein n=1 Tax=Branchiostoma lanceolatum TaxID=7740 RepID=A0A8J9VI94_BRALA|nr:Hypp6167 [Branchiostoma lanceolatum]
MVEYPDIVNHQVFSASWATNEQVKAYKSTEAYDFFVSGWVDTLHMKMVDFDVMTDSLLQQTPCHSTGDRGDHGPGMPEELTVSLLDAYYVKRGYSVIKIFMLTKEQKSRLLSLWKRGLMTTNRRYPYISALAEEAAEAGLSWQQTASFVKGQRVKTGLNRWDPEAADLLLTVVQALGNLRVRRGTTYERVLKLDSKYKVTVNKDSLDEKNSAQNIFIFRHL